ncbi:unnamed protein product, partial [Musa hybrid cultivar]
CAQAVHTLTTQPHPIPLGFPFLRDALFCSSSSWLGMSIAVACREQVKLLFVCFGCYEHRG